MIDYRYPYQFWLICLQALPHICTSHFESVMFRAVLLSTFLGFMRVGEYTARSRCSIQSSLLFISGIEFRHRNTIISFKRGKTNQRGPAKTVKLAQSQNVTLCPVTALCNYIAVRPRISQPLFCHFDGSPLTTYQFNAVLKKILCFCGLEGCIIGLTPFALVPQLQLLSWHPANGSLAVGCSFFIH